MRREKFRYLRHFILISLVIINGFVLTGCSRFIKEKTEHEAKEHIKKIRTAEQAFFKSYGRYAGMNELLEKKLLAPPEYDFSKTGYQFTIEDNKDTFELVGVPTKDIDYYLPFSFYLDQTGVIRGKSYRDRKPASKTDEALRETP